MDGSQNPEDLRRNALKEGISTVSRLLQTPNPTHETMEEIARCLSQAAVILESPQGQDDLDFAMQLCPLPSWMAFLTIPAPSVWPPVCAVLSAVLAHTRFLSDAVTEQTVPYLIGGFLHSSHDVRNMCLVQLRRYVQLLREKSISMLIKHGLIGEIAKALSDPKTLIGESAISLLLEISKYMAGLDFILESKSMSLLSVAASKSEVVKIRVMSLFAQMAAISDTHFDRVLISGALNMMFDTLNSQDILVKLNTFEIIEQISHGSKSRIYFHEKGIFKSVIEMFDENDAFFPMTAPQLLNLIGRLFSSDEFVEYITEYPIDCIVKKGIESDIPEVQQATVSCVGLICSSRKGTDYILRCDEVMYRVCCFLDSPTAEVKINANQAASKFFYSSSMDEILSTKAYEIYKRLSTENGLDIAASLYRLLRLPFQDLRVSSFCVLSSVVKHPWGLDHWSKIDGSTAYLLDRGTETTKEGREWKFELAKSVVDTNRKHPTLHLLHMKQLEIHLRQGPYYRPTEAAVEVASMHS